MCRMRWLLAGLLVVSCGGQRPLAPGSDGGAGDPGEGGVSRRGDGGVREKGDGGVSRPAEGQSCSLSSDVLWRSPVVTAAWKNCTSDELRFASSDQICHCRGGKVVCATAEAACTAGWLPDTDCVGEGSQGCSPPVATYCGCSHGTWSCSTPGCPDGCPENYSPSDGASCTLPSTIRCRYETTTCTCVAGKFSCH